MVQQEKRLLWHPRNENRFVVGGGSQITLYEWLPEGPEIRQVIAQQDLHYMKCFAWSPDPTYDDIIAVGVNTGRVDLIRLEAAKRTKGVKLSNGPSVSLSVRNSRACNAVAFCNTDPNYLAVGLDKVRGDCSLVIWDIISSIPALSVDTNTPSNETVSPVSTSRPQPQIPRLESNPRTDPRILQQYAPQEIVSCLSFLPKSTNLLLAGISYRWLRLFDLRSSSSNVLSAPGKVQAIATDSFDQYRVATFGDNTVSIWDTRRLTTSLTFSERDAAADNIGLRAGSAFSTIEFSSTRRGCLATLEKESPYVRFWDIQHAPNVFGEYSSLSVADGARSSKDLGKNAAKRSWTAPFPWQSGGQQQYQGSPRSGMSPLESSLILANTRRTKMFNKPISSFALVPDPASSHPLTSGVMVVNKEGDLELYAIYDTPKQSVWSTRGDLTFGAGVNLTTISGLQGDPGIVLSSMEYRLNFQGRVGNSQSRPTRARGAPFIRGRMSKSRSATPGPMLNAPPALFGRGDEDGFPALGSAPSSAPTGLSATRPPKTRTYSPSTLRKYHTSEQSDRQGSHSLVKRSLSRGESMPMSGDNGLLDEKSFESERMRRKLRIRDGKLSEVTNTVEDDISMSMFRRAMLGYGLSQPQQNMWITREEYNPLDVHSQSLSDIWAWITHSQQFLCTPVSRVQGYDFAHQGILGILEGLPPLHDVAPLAMDRPLLDFPSSTATHERRSSKTSVSSIEDFYGNFQAALMEIESRKAGERSTWKPIVNTSKLVQRQVAMKLCGWSLKEDELSAAILRWEKERQFTRAAAWLVFTRQYSRALDMLMKSNDMSHKMMSGTIAALIPHGTSATPSRNYDLREHCERIIKDMNDPYFCAILTYLAVGDWADVLKEEDIPLRERLAIALQFLEDKPLTTYLRQIMEHAIARGDIDGLIVTGLTKSGIDILQKYVDISGDVQTAAILGSYVCPHQIRDCRVVRWLDTYRDTLDGFKLHHQRVMFDIERGQILTEAMQNGDIPPMELVPKQILIRCNYCNKSVVPEGPLELPAQVKWKPTTCSNCEKALPRCSVCLLTLSIIPDAAREIELNESPYKDTIDDAIVICQTCRHGGHANHLMEWFFEEHGRSRQICPVADCDCRCVDEF